MNETRTYSEEDANTLDHYSDDFVSDEDRGTLTPKKTSTPHRSANHQYYQDRFRGRGKGSGGQRGRGRGRGVRVRRGRGSSRASEPADMKKSHDSITNRVLSATRNRVNELRNKMEELKIQMRELEQENKLYKKMQFRQEKAIRGFEDKENDLPSILDKHNNEVRALREQNRRLKEKYDKSDRFLRDAEDELERVKKKMKQYKDMCEEKELMERDELTQKLTKAEVEMEEQNVKIKELQRHIEVLKKNHRHELGIEVTRQKELKKQVEELTKKNSFLETQLKEKEKALEVANIYSRPLRSSRDNSPDSGSPNIKSRKKASSLTELTPRDKAKLYADKRRAELLKHKELKEEKERRKKQKWEEEEQEKEKNVVPGTPSDVIDRRMQEKEEQGRKWREREIKERLAKEEIERKQKELERRRDLDNKAKERKEKEKWEKAERERKTREEREQREREEREKKEREEHERRKREEGEYEEKERKEKQEREHWEREKAELERRLQLEKEKLQNDLNMQEERKKKDELLRKLQALDERGSSSTDPFAPTSPNRKNREHSRMSGFGDGIETQSKRSEPKEYSFTKPVNNLHQGKPSHEDVIVPYLERQRSRQQASEDSLGGYQPSFGPPKGGNKSKSNASLKTASVFDDDEPALKLNSTTSSNAATKSDKKSSNLLENLFGPQANSNKTMSTKRIEESETIFGNHKSPILNHHTGNTSGASATVFPWDSTHTKTNKSVFDIEKSSTIFGGGALLDDDLSPSNNKVLPRRQRQPNFNTFSAKPSVTAVDNFDDEIEEVVL